MVQNGLRNWRRFAKWLNSYRMRDLTANRPGGQFDVFFANLCRRGVLKEVCEKRAVLAKTGRIPVVCFQWFADSFYRNGGCRGQRHGVLKVLLQLGWHLGRKEQLPRSRPGRTGQVFASRFTDNRKLQTNNARKKTAQTISSCLTDY